MHRGVSKSHGIDEDLPNGCTNEMIHKFLNDSRALIMNVFPDPDDEDALTDTGFVRLFSLTCILNLYFEFKNCIIFGVRNS